MCKGILQVSKHRLEIRWVNTGTFNDVGYYFFSGVLARIGSMVNGN